jgi:hypothetical protein
MNMIEIVNRERAYVRFFGRIALSLGFEGSGELRGGRETPPEARG